MVRRIILLSLLGTCTTAVFGDDPSDRKPPVDPEHARNMAAGLKIFKEQVRAILVSRCVKCHGGEEIESELDLTTRAGLLRGGAEGPSVTLGAAADSRLYRLITHVAEPEMPAEGKKLLDQQIADIARWIDLGAPYDKPLINPELATTSWTERTIQDEAKKYWAFRPLTKHTPPKAATGESVVHPIDLFLTAAARDKKINPNPPTDRRTLARRLFFDLIGLPPTAEQVERFVANKEPDAVEKLVDRLLESDHYGERWARHWLDVARFGESHGFEQDYDRPHAYHYRDFVIRALNDDMPYDQFVRWQIAGDELAPDNPLAMMATGFLGAGVFPTQLTEKEFESSRYDELDDMIGTIGTSMLGMTIGCARCHDHKFDPIPQADYYRLISTFSTTIRSHVDLQLPDGTKSKVQVTSEGYRPIKHHADGRGFPHFYKDTYYLKRGDHNQKQGKAEQGFLQVLMNAPDGEKHWQLAPPEGWRTSYRRRALAAWITDTRHGAGHLLARVIVNRLWHHHFGRGIVATPNDFGVQGAAPAHPELLDWLATRLIESGWSIKSLHRLMLTSAAFARSSKASQTNTKVDPHNETLWRFAPRRLEAEVIRDAMLAISGQLDRKMFGKGTLDPNMKRRSIYFMIKRSRLVPMMQVFDFPEPLVSVGHRPQTTIAPQALLFINSPQVRGYARGFAQQLLPVASQSTAKAVQHGYLSAVGRPPAYEELHAGQEFIKRQIESYGQSNQKQAMELAWTDYCQILMCLNEFVYMR